MYVSYRRKKIMRLDQFIDLNQITLTHKPYPDYIGKMHGHHYKVTLALGKRVLRTEYHKGSGHCGVPPTAAEVLESLVSEQTDQPFRDWASDLDYNVTDAADRREARKTWRACVKIRAKLRFLLGDDGFETLIQDVEM